MNTKLLFRAWLTILLALILAAAFTGTGLAQEDKPELRLHIGKNMGYQSGINVQGSIGIRASGPDDLEKVTFYMDGEVFGTAEGPDFRLNFNTANYEPGLHTFSAEGTTTSGRTVRSSEAACRFLTADEANEATGKIMLPMLAVVFGALLLSFAIPMLTNRGKKQSLAPGAPRNYGPLGGTICPKCGRPFGMHLYKMNLVIGALDRCPYCGKWSLVRHVPMEALRAAEEAELDGSEAEVPQESEEEKLRKELDDSRYSDL